LVLTVVEENHTKEAAPMLTEQELGEHPDNIEGLEGLDPSW
jgi:hypothetical protein